MGKRLDQPKFRYPLEKLEEARRALMAPHYDSEADSFYRAFELCDRGLHDFDEQDVEGDARSWLATIKHTMDITGISAPDSKWLIKAKQLTYDEKCDFSNAVDALTHWLSGKFYGY
jgi:hypothetical protein